MLIESSALYAAVSICFIVPYAMSHHASAVFLSVLSRVQIIAPLLIIRRVATQRALTASNMAGGAPAEHSARFNSVGGAGTHNYPLSPIFDTKRDGVDIMTTIEFANDMDDPKAPWHDQKV